MTKWSYVCALLGVLPIRMNSNVTIEFSNVTIGTIRKKSMVLCSTVVRKSKVLCGFKV